MQDLAGKVAVVTGGGGGIGRALGERFLAEGHAGRAGRHRRAAARRHGRGARRPRTATSSASSPTCPCPTRSSSCATPRSTRFGSVHLVCNNAGIPSGSDGALWQHHVNDWRWAVDVNVFGVINGINTFVPVLLEQGGPGPRREHVVVERHLRAAVQQRGVRDDQGRGHQHHRVPVGPAPRRSARRSRCRCCSRRPARPARSTPVSGDPAATGPSATRARARRPSRAATRSRRSWSSSSSTDRS